MTGIALLTYLAFLLFIPRPAIKNKNCNLLISMGNAASFIPNVSYYYLLSLPLYSIISGDLVRYYTALSQHNIICIEPQADYKMIY